MKSLKPVLSSNNRQGSLNRHSVSQNTSLTNLKTKEDSRVEEREKSAGKFNRKY
jgi:hypothetical protein